MTSFIPSPQLYRYWSLNRLKDLIKNKKLIFVNPVFWEDSLDRLFIETDYSSLGFKQPTIYCLCFNTNIVSEKIHWRLYKTKEQLLVRSSFRTEVLFKVIQRFAEVNKFKVYFQPVNYSLTENEIVKLNATKNKNHEQYFGNFSQDKYLELLSLKPNIYEHENELRIFLVPKTRKKHPYKAIEIPITNEDYKLIFNGLKVFLRESISLLEDRNPKFSLELDLYMRNNRIEELKELYPYTETEIHEPMNYKAVKKI